MSITGKGLAEHGKKNVGKPYFYGSKMNVLTEAFMKQMHKSYPSTVTTSYMNKARKQGQVGKVNTDCSGLISSYTGKVLGSSQLYSQAYTRMAMSTWRSWAPGVVVWHSGHVGIYLGDGKVAEARGINYGVVVTDIESRPWKYGLTFKWIDYTYDTPVNKDDMSWKGTNPYTKPNTLVTSASNAKKHNVKSYTAKGDTVKWVQWELNEAGYKLDVDGICGTKTVNAITSFQSSSKLVADGLCGPATIKALVG